jgi:sugar lactone lactonase YvrE
MSQEPEVLEAQPLLTGLVIGESPRWHDGRLWFAHWGTGEIVAVDLDGDSEVVGEGPAGLGWSIDWLLDGRLLLTGEGLTRREPDGSMMPHADLSSLGVGGFNEIVVDGRGNIYVNGGADFEPGPGEAPGIIALITPDGSVRRVADGIAFPNGMAVTPDNSTLIVAESFAARLTAFDIADDGDLSNRRASADGVGPDGICIDPRVPSGRASGGSARTWSGASATAARCSSESGSPCPASPACGGATTRRRCSCSWPTGASRTVPTAT